MARPSKHDGSLVRAKGESNVWWMQYRDKDGIRQRESTGTEDWNEAQQRLRERLQSRDSNTLSLLRKGEQCAPLGNGRMYFLETFSKPPMRARKTHLK